MSALSTTIQLGLLRRLLSLYMTYSTVLREECALQDNPQGCEGNNTHGMMEHTPAAAAATVGSAGAKHQAKRQ